ncbi:thrombopoietin isoform X3 [Channa argus]|uniref:thrombopoietin isoform X3 n=1 Tax=Channa argus TaxID=215402 RepID=UPI0035203521
MALRRILLLCMVASEVWDAEPKPIDFVCNRAARRAMNTVAEMESALLPCTELHVESWENKSHQEKRGEIVASLKLLTEGVKALKGLSLPRCASLVLQRLEINVNNYRLILTNLRLSQGPVVSPSLSCVPISTNSLSTFLLKYNQLIIGKLERFLVKLEDTCTSQ